MDRSSINEKIIQAQAQFLGKTIPIILGPKLSEKGCTVMHIFEELNSYDMIEYQELEEILLAYHQRKIPVLGYGKRTPSKLLESARSAWSSRSKENIQAFVSLLKSYIVE